MNSVINISIRELFYKYQCGSEFSLNIPKAHFSFTRPLGIYGLAGSGKSTLGKTLASLIAPLKGSIKFNYSNSENSEPQETPSVLYSTQFPERVFLGTRVRDTVDYIASKNSHPERFRLNMTGCLEKFSLNYKDIQAKNGHEMSGGELRRFALSLSFALQPDLLILDEPTIGLGGKGKEELGNVIKYFTRERALIVISHDLQIISNICPYIWIMRKGKVIFNGYVANVKNSNPLVGKVGLSYYKELDMIIRKRRFEMLGIGTETTEVRFGN